MPEVVEISGIGDDARKRQGTKTKKKRSRSLGKSKELTAAQRRKIPASKYGLPKQRKYPMENVTHAQNAKARATEEFHKGRLNRRQWNSITKKADGFIKKYRKERKNLGAVKKKQTKSKTMEPARYAGLTTVGKVEVKATKKELGKAARTLDFAMVSIRKSMKSYLAGDSKGAAANAIRASVEAAAAFKKNPELATRIFKTARGVVKKVAEGRSSRKLYGIKGLPRIAGVKGLSQLFPLGRDTHPTIMALMKSQSNDWNRVKDIVTSREYSDDGQIPIGFIMSFPGSVLTPEERELKAQVSAQEGVREQLGPRSAERDITGAKVAGLKGMGRMGRMGRLGRLAQMARYLGK
jgi:hypothetical protein